MPPRLPIRWAAALSKGIDFVDFSPLEAFLKGWGMGS